MKFKYLEIGVAQGDNAVKTLNENPDLYYTGVDQWLYDTSMEHEVKKIQNWNSQKIWDEIYEKVLTKLNPYGDRAKVLRGSSRDILPKMKDTFDTILVDGDHSEEGAYQDMLLSIPLLKKDGTMIIDDLHYESVRSAITRFIEYHPEYKIINRKNNQAYIQLLKTENE